MKKTSKNRVGFGTFPFDEEVWGPITEIEAIDILRESYERGVSYFNSAYYYGKGRCEEILGKAVKKMDRDRVIIATKVGAEFGEFSLSKQRINKSIESILRRMKLEYIDTLILHRPDEETPLEETMGAILSLKVKGLIKSIGLSNFPVNLAAKALKIAPVEVFEFYFSLLNQKEGNKILKFCKENEITATPYKVIERGILTDSFSLDNDYVIKLNQKYENPYTFPENLQKTESLVLKLRKLAKQKGLTLAQLAIAWALNQGEKIIPLIGVRNKIHLLEDLKATDVKLSEEDLKDLDIILKS